MSSAALLVALRAELRPLTSIEDAERLREFCSVLATEPRYFGPGAQPITPRLTVSRLLHPAGPPCLGAVLGDTVSRGVTGWNRVGRSEKARNCPSPSVRRGGERGSARAS